MNHVTEEACSWIVRREKGEIDNDKLKHYRNQLVATVLSEMQTKHILVLLKKWSKAQPQRKWTFLLAFSDQKLRLFVCVVDRQTLNVPNRMRLNRVINPIFSLSFNLLA